VPTVASGSLSDSDLLAVLHETATAVRKALDGLSDWGLAGTVDSQYHHDLVADEAALSVLRGAGLSVVSEESGATAAGVSSGAVSSGGVSSGGVVVVLDPVDGSTNASHGIPWWNTSLCAVDPDGARAAVVVNQADGRRYEAVRGGGARCDGRPLVPSGCTSASAAMVGLNGLPPRHLGWKQYRALGATALDLCAVAAGVLDGWIDCTRRGNAPWDYLGGMLICLEAGAVVVDAEGQDLVTVDHAARRTPVAAATPELLAELLGARRSFS